MTKQLRISLSQLGTESITISGEFYDQVISEKYISFQAFLIPEEVHLILPDQGGEGLVVKPDERGKQGIADDFAEFDALLKAEGNSKALDQWIKDNVFKEEYVLSKEPHERQRNPQRFKRVLQKVEQQWLKQRGNLIDASAKEKVKEEFQRIYAFLDRPSICNRWILWETM